MSARDVQWGGLARRASQFRRIEAVAGARGCELDQLLCAAGIARRQGYAREGAGS